MDLIQLQYFRVAARKGNFTLAAAELHITQPALSKMISNLEADLGCKLFDREGKRIHLNANGEVVLRNADAIFSQIDEMTFELSDLTERVSGHLRIGFSLQTREPDPFLLVLHHFMADYPDVIVRYQSMNIRELQSGLRDKTIDIALTSSSIATNDIVWNRLYQETLGIILARNHPLAAKEVLSLSDLKDEYFFSNNAGNDMQDLTYEFCEKAGFTPKMRFEGHFPSYIGESISKGLGVSFIPEKSFRRQFRRDMEIQVLPWAENITFRPIAEDYTVHDCGYAFLLGRYQPRAVKLFCKYLEDAFIV